MKTIYLLRINSKLRTRDDNPDDNGLIIDDIEIDEGKTKEILLSYLPSFSNVTDILISPALRAQQTAQVLLDLLKENKPGPRIKIEIGFSGFVKDEEKDPQFATYRIRGKGLIAEGDYPNGVPTQNRWAGLFPGIDIETADYWQMLKAFFEVGEQDFKPFWTAKRIGKRGAEALENALRSSKGDCIAISHSGVIEPTVACALGVDINRVIEALDDKKLDFLESISLTYEQGEGFVEATIREDKIKSRMQE